MKTTTLSRICLLSLLLMGFLSGQAWAQTQPKRDDGNIRLTVRKSAQGEVTYLEDQRYLRSEDEVNEILAEYGVDSQVEELAPGEEVEIVLRRRKPATAAAGNEDAQAARPMLGVLYSVEAVTLGRVDRVFAGTGAEKAGMRVGDVITAIDGETIRSGDQIRDIIASHQPGETVRLTYTRNGQKRETIATLGEWRDIPVEQRVPSLSPDWQYRYPNNGNFNSSLPAPGYLGVTTNPSYSPENPGDFIVEVIPNSPAAAAGLSFGDRILKVNGESITRENPTTVVIPKIAAGTDVALVVKKRLGMETVVINLKLANRNDFVHRDYPIRDINTDVVRPQPEYQQTAWLGVQPVVELGVRDGALVDLIFDDSPAEALGLRTGDRIVSVGGKPVANWSELVETVRQHSPGDVVVVEWLRKGQAMHGTAALGSKQADNPNGFQGEEWEEIRITVRKAELTAEEIEALDKVVDGIEDGMGSLSAESLEIFPNPSNGDFTVNMTLNNDASVTFQVFDLQGRKIWSQSSADGLTQHSFALDLKGQPAGSYYLVATQKGQSLVRKLVVL